MPPTESKDAPRIMIVEDEVIIAADLAGKLTALGYGICGQAASGDEALRLAEKERPDLILMDIALQGGMDGIGTAEAIRSRWSIPVVFLTAYSDRERLARAKMTCPFGYLIKPFQERDLAVTLEMALYVARVEAGRRKAEEAWRETEAVLHEVQAIAGIGSFVWDLRDDSLEFSRNMLAISGLAAGAFSGKMNDEVCKLVHPDDQARVRQEIARMIEQGETRPMEFRVVLPDGRERIWQCQSRFVRDASGAPVKAVGLHCDITEQRRTEEEREILASLVEVSPAAVTVQDFDDNFIYANQYAAELHGYTLEEFLSLKLYKVDDEESAALIEERLAQLREQDEISFDVWHLKKDGSRFPLHVHNRLARWKSQDVVLSVAFDISERHRAAVALKQSEEKYRAYVDHSPVAIFLANDQGRYMDVNRAATEMLGYTREELLGLGISDVRYHQTKEANPESFARLLKTGSLRSEIKLRRKDGSAVDAVLEATALTGGRYLGFCSDISERKRMEDTLRVVAESGASSGHDFFRFLVRQLAVAQGVRHALLSRIDRDDPGRAQTIAVWSDGQYAENFSYVIEGAPCEFVVRQGATLFPRGVGSRFRPEPRLAALEMESYWGAPLKDSNGQVMGILALMDDRPMRENGTTLSLLNSLAARAAAEMQRLQAEEDRSRLQAQLIQAQKMESIGTLAGGVAHDFNNLLQAINGYTQLLLMDKPAGSVDHAGLREIQKAGERAAQLVQQLLLFGRKVEIARRPVDINQEVEQARRILERTIPKMIRIEVLLDGALKAVKADPVQIEQVLLNLGGNSADAMPDGGLLVIETRNLTIDAENAHQHEGVPKGGYVLIKVSDTGCGMEPWVVQHIFDPFFTTKGVGKGTGLGLSSVYGIVKGHGGYITCVSAPEKGTIFNVYLPASEAHVQPVVRQASAGFPSGGSECILLVDDEPPIRDMATRTLSRFGYSVETACNGEEALSLYAGRQDRFDLVILDLGMPGMGGHKCLQEMLRINPLAKILIASGYSLNDRIMGAMKPKVAGFLAKPYEIRSLLEKVRSVLDSDEDRAGGAVTPRPSEGAA